MSAVVAELPAAILVQVACHANDLPRTSLAFSHRSLCIIPQLHRKATLQGAIKQASSSSNSKQLITHHDSRHPTRVHLPHHRRDHARPARHPLRQDLRERGDLGVDHRAQLDLPRDAQAAGAVGPLSLPSTARQDPRMVCRQRHQGQGAGLSN
jgi:hypothetical protein